MKITMDIRNLPNSVSSVRGEAGVTLIELMITVVIVAILATIAYPSYQQYVARANRAEAAGILLENAQILERNYTTASRYDDKQQDGDGTDPPDIIAQSPKPVSTAKYNITVAFPDSQSFTLSAAPTGVMTGDALCGTLTLSNTGDKTESGSGDVSDCWQ